MYKSNKNLICIILYYRATIDKQNATKSKGSAPAEGKGSSSKRVIQETLKIPQG